MAKKDREASRLCLGDSLGEGGYWGMAVRVGLKLPDDGGGEFAPVGALYLLLLLLLLWSLSLLLALLVLLVLLLLLLLLLFFFFLLLEPRAVGLLTVSLSLGTGDDLGVRCESEP